MKKIVLLPLLLTISLIAAQVPQQRSDNYPTPNVDLNVFIRNPHWDGALATAHNGGILYGPQDSIFVFKKSCEAGADIVEVDVRITGDGHLIAFHDEDFNFLNSTGSGMVRERTLDYVRSIRSVSPIPGVADQPIPTFREALQFLRERHVCLNVEPKDDTFEEIIRVAGEEKMLGNILLQAKSPDKARIIRGLSSEVGMLARYRRESDLEKFLPYHPEAMEIDPDTPDEMIARIREHGIKVQMKVGYLKDLDFDKEHWRKRINRGVNIALTDFIPEMVGFLRENAFNMGSEAKKRQGSKGLTGCTYINIDPECAAAKDGNLKFCRVMTSGKARGKLKVFRQTGDRYSLVFQSQITDFRAGMNIVGMNAKVKKGDMVAIYLEAGDVEADRVTSKRKAVWRKGDSGTAAKDQWISDEFSFSADGMIR